MAALGGKASAALGTLTAQLLQPLPFVSLLVRAAIDQPDYRDGSLSMNSRVIGRKDNRCRLHGYRLRPASDTTRSRTAFGSTNPFRARSMIRVATISRPFSSPANTRSAIQASSKALDIAAIVSGRLLKTATDEARRNYLGRLIVEEQQKQKDAGDSEYQY